MKKKLSTILAIICCVLACFVLPTKAMAATSAKPGKVTMVSVTTDECENGMRIVWEKAANATNYMIYFKEVSGGKWKKAISIDGYQRGYWFTYEPGKDLLVGKEYACTVRAYNKKSKTYGSFDKNGIRFKILPETVEISGIRMDQKKSGVVLTWNKKDGSAITRADYYNIYRKQAGKWKKIAKVKKTANSYTDTKFEPGKLNTYAVRAYDSKTKTMGNYDKSGISIDLREKKPSIVYNSSYRSVILKGKTETYTYNSSGSSTKWYSSNKKVVKLTPSGKYKCKIKAVSEGTALITVKAGTKVETFTVIVASGNNYIEKWVQNMAREVKMASSDKETQLLLVSKYFVDGFSYANEHDMKTVISARKGNCYSTGQVMVKVYQALGYKAKLRSAIHDDPKRYPSNMIMGSDHYNVEVIAGGRTYYLDATPQAHLIYLSSKTEPLEAYTDLFGNGWMRI